jgi:DNA polymerase-3 subunit delta
LVVVENADPFVTRHRPLLEKYVGQPATTGVLVLEVKSWPANTKLAKLIDEAATLVCKTPATFRLPAWCVKWTAARHGKKLDTAAAELLVDLVGPDMGLLDQELNKLAIYVGAAGQIGSADVDALVGRSRAAETFKIFDAIGAGRRADALAILDRLFEQGEDALAILGAFSWQLRRLAQVARHVRQGTTPAAAMELASVPPFARQGIEQQLRHLGLRRAGHLYDWLLEVDLGLKGNSPLPPRLQMERLLVKLARPREDK